MNVSKRCRMVRWICGLGAALLVGGPALGDVVAPPISQRVGVVDAKETVSFQRHVVPLLGRLGCSGRACHGSFQGQGGFRLSLFGYDFRADHQALLRGDAPRVNVAEPADSLM